MAFSYPKLSHNHRFTSWKLLPIGFLLALLLVSMSNCQGPELPDIDHFVMDLEDQNRRIDAAQQELSFNDLRGLKVGTDDYTFTTLTTVKPPQVAGSLVQACYLYSDGSKIYVAYNMAGLAYKGAVDVFEFSLDKFDTKLTAVKSLGFPHSDINSLAVIPDPSDDLELFLVGATIGYPSYNLGSPGHLICFESNLSNYQVLDLPGYAANSISYEQGASWLSVTSGSNGGLTMVNRTSILSPAFMAKANLSSVFNYGDLAFQICADPCALLKYDRNTLSNQTIALTGYSSDREKKSSVVVKYGHSFLALNDGGTVIVDNSSNSIVNNLTPSNPDGVEAKYLVSNGLCVGNYRLFIANGGGGLTIAELDLNMDTQIIGYVNTRESVNHVIMLEENGNSGYLALVTGRGGLQIVYYIYNGEEHLVTTADILDITSNSCLTGGTIVDNGGPTITDRGVCWSINDNPTISDNTISEGAGAGSFTSSISGLSKSKRYYVRAYATSSLGTIYGDEKSFLTQSGLPTFTDARDGNEYEFVTIGTQIWMAQNLAYLPSVSPDNIVSDAETHFYVYNYKGTDVEEAKKFSFMSINTVKTIPYIEHGVLYNWDAASIACPAGWHFPSDDEWQTLEMYLGMSQTDAEAEFDTPRTSGDVAMQIRSVSDWGIIPEGNGTNSSGFNVLPSGYVSMLGDGSKGIKEGASYWTATLFANSYGVSIWPYQRSMGSENYEIKRAYTYQELGKSIRCVKD